MRRLYVAVCLLPAICASAPAAAQKACLDPLTTPSSVLREADASRICPADKKYQPSPVSIAPKAAAANEPDLQRKLEELAVHATPKTGSLVTFTGADIGPRSITVHATEMPGSGYTLAQYAQAWSAVDWAKKYCNDPLSRDLMDREGVTITTTFNPSDGGAPSSYSVTARNCQAKIVAAPAPKAMGKKGAVFAAPPTKEYAHARIMQFLNGSLIDPESARVSCSEVSGRAWVWPGVFFPKHYGYLVICEVNAKNRLGGYTGAKQYVFRFNGDEFEWEEVVPKMGLVE